MISGEFDLSVGSTMGLVGVVCGVILQAGDSFDTAQLFVPVIILMALGVVLTWFVGWLEHKVAPWQHEIAGGEG